MSSEVGKVFGRPVAQFLGCLVALFLTCWVSVVPAKAQEIIFLIRHAERDFSSPDGRLVEAGRERAEEWVDVLSDVGLDVIITSEMRRTKETGAPISEELEIPSRVFTRYDVDGLVELLQTEYADDRVLLVSHSSSIPEIIRALGSDAWISVPKSDYNDLFVVNLARDGSASVARLNID